MGRRSWGLWAVVAMLLVSAPDSGAAPQTDPTCDFPAQTTAGATVCEHTTGSPGMEPMLAVDKRGTLFMGMATDKGLYEQPGELTGSAENYLLRSRDDGRTWQRIRLPGGIDASEGFPYIDPVTDRLFVTSLGVRRHALRPTRDPQRRRRGDLDRRGAAAGMLAGDPGGLAEDLQRAVQGQGAGPLSDRRLRLQLHPERARRRLDRLLAIRRRRRPFRVHGLPADGQRPLQGRRRPGRQGGDDRPRQRAGAVERRRRGSADRVRQARGGSLGRRGEDVEGNRHRGAEPRVGGRARAARGNRARDHRSRLVGEPRSRRPRQPLLRLHPRRGAPDGLARRRSLMASPRTRDAARHCPRHRRVGHGSRQR